jgi:hypothetical protein
MKAVSSKGGLTSSRKSKSLLLPVTRKKIPSLTLVKDTYTEKKSFPVGEYGLCKKFTIILEIVAPCALCIVDIKMKSNWGFVIFTPISFPFMNIFSSFSCLNSTEKIFSSSTKLSSCSFQNSLTESLSSGTA